MNRKVKKTRQILSAFIILAAVAGFTSCEKYLYSSPSVDPSVPLHFQTDIQPIFNANCVSCHGGTRSPDLSEGKSFQSLTKGGYINTPAKTSKLYSRMISSDHISRSSETDRLKVLYWITQGARNN